MEKDRSSKVIAIVALIVAVVGLSVGFAAYSQNLVISSSAEVKGDASKFDVQFSTSNSSVAEEKEVTPKYSPTNDEFFTATNATIDGTKISNLKATFKEGKEKQTVTYDFYVYNNGELNAFLKSVTFAQESPQCKSSASGNPASENLVTEACSDVSVKVTVDSTSYDKTTDNLNVELPAKETGKSVSVVIEYADSKAVDGDFDVTFGDITLNFSSAQA